MYPYHISIILPIYNRPEELILTLNSIRKQTLPKAEFQVVVADDGSAGDIGAVLKNYRDLHISYCRQEDQGFRVAAVRNLGIRNALGEILVFNDNGVLLTPGVLAQHKKLHERQSNLVVLGNMFGTDWKADTDKIRQLLEQETVSDAIAAMKRLGGMGDGREGYFSRFGEDVAAWYIPWLALWGGHFSVRRDFLDQNRIAFDEHFTSWGGEDNDFGIQCCRAGGEYRFARDIEVVHYPTPDRPNSDITTKEFKKHYKEVKTYIANKHRSEDTRVWYEIGSAANDPEKREEILPRHDYEK